MTPVRPVRALLILLGLPLLLGFSQGVVLAEEDTRQDSEVVLKEGIDYPAPGPDEHLGLGHIDSIDMESGAVTIDDANYVLTPSTDYHTSVMGAGSIHLFREGQAVGFIADRKGRIQSIWLIE